jgi:ATP-dependent RNA helicase DDX42
MASSDLRVVAAFGGLSKFDQFKDLKGGCEIAVATPGRLIDLIKMKACTMQRVTFVVLDEADRMFDMGFEPQVITLFLVF